MTIVISQLQNLCHKSQKFKGMHRGGETKQRNHSERRVE